MSFRTYLRLEIALFFRDGIFVPFFTPRLRCVGGPVRVRLGHPEDILGMSVGQEIPVRDFAVRAWNEVTGRCIAPRGPGCAGRQAA